MIHAMVYDRASTQGQKDNYSRVNAHDVGIRIAEQNGFTWEYIKEIGSDTTLTGRPEMMKILDRIAAGEIQALIVQDLDRLARPEEAVVYTTIRQVIMAYNVVIYTHTSRVDLNNDDDLVGDITMAVSKAERRRIIKRMKRGLKARVESGRFIGGGAPLGYKIVFEERGSQKPISDYAIDPAGAELVKVIFDQLEQAGGNICKAAKELNEAGYTSKKGNPFLPNAVRRIATRKLYIGIFESSVTDKVTHRPDLQIITLDQFEHVQDLIKGRDGNGKDMGRRGHYLFTGFAACGGCGGPMVAGNKKSIGDGISYGCTNRRKFGTAGCSTSHTYTERLILPPVVEFLAGFVHSYLDFDSQLEAAAARYGKSITEEALEAAITGEIASVKAGKERLIEAISLGILTTQEAAAKLAELREQEQRLTVELSGIARKAKLMGEWETVLERLKGADITPHLHDLAENNPIGFREFLSFVFKPNSLHFRTERTGNSYRGVLVQYELTEEAKEMMEKAEMIEKAYYLLDTNPKQM